MENVKIRVIVQPEEYSLEIPVGGKYDVPAPSPLPKPIIPRKLLTKLNKPTYSGKFEFTFEGKI